MFSQINNSKFGGYDERIFTLKLETRDTIVRSVSYLDLHLEIENKGQLKTTLYDKTDDFTFRILNFTFLVSNISASFQEHIHTKNISPSDTIARACISYHVLIDRGSLLTRKL